MLWHHNSGVNGLALEDPWLVSAASGVCGDRCRTSDNAQVDKCRSHRLHLGVQGQVGVCWGVGRRQLGQLASLERSP